MKKESNLETHTVTSLTGLIQLVEDTCHGECVLFRGQSNDWDLLPKIARISPKRGNDILTTESKMLADFKRLSKPFLKKIPENEWEWLALAQHHGLATRLLDWSTNPLAALWFVVKNPPSGSNGVIWLFDVPEEDILTPKDISQRNPFAGARTNVFQPEISTVRIQSQNGWFTVHKYMSESQKFIAFQNNARYKKHLKKILIPTENFYTLRFQLDRMGVNKLSLFPDLDGAADYCEWLNCFLEDEHHSILKSNRTSK